MKKIKLGPQGLLFPMPAVLVGSRIDGTANFMTAAWCGIASHQPPALSVAIRESRFTMKGIEENQYSCIIDHYRKLMASGVQIDSYRVDNCYWTDMGTVDDYLALHEGLLTESIPCWQEMGEIRKPYCIDKGARLPPQVDLEGWVCIGASDIGNQTYFSRCVVWDDVFVGEGVKVSDSIISSDQ